MKNDAMKNAPAGENERPLMLAPAFKDYIWGGERLKRDWGKQTDLSPLAESWELSCTRPGRPSSRPANGRDGRSHRCWPRTRSLWARKPKRRANFRCSSS